MSTSEIRHLAEHLSSDEKADLAIELWESAGQEVPVPQWHRELIQERLEKLEGRIPEERSVPWDEVRRRIWPDER